MLYMSDQLHYLWQLTILYPVHNKNKAFDYFLCNSQRRAFFFYKIELVLHRWLFMCVGLLCLNRPYTSYKVVSHYDLSVLSMSVFCFQKQFG